MRKIQAMLAIVILSIILSVSIFEKTAFGSNENNVAVVSGSWQVDTSTDDAARALVYSGPLYFNLSDNSYFNISDGEDFAGAYTSRHYQYGCGLRFTGINIPNGATIVSARIRFVCRYEGLGGPCNTRLSAEAADNPPTFTSNQIEFDRRFENRTTAINWDNIPGWTVGGVYYSESILSVIQDTVNRPGWNKGNAIAIFWEDFENRSILNGEKSNRCAYSYDSSPSLAPTLEIAWISNQNTPTTEQAQSFFFVQSNSTITHLFFNSTSSEISFKVNGTSGTTGYVKITVAKSLVPSIQDVKVYLDSSQLNFEMTSNEDSWILLFTYTHSTHQVSVNLRATVEAEPTILGLTYLNFALLIAIIVLLIVVIVLALKKK